MSLRKNCCIVNGRWRSFSIFLHQGRHRLFVPQPLGAVATPEDVTDAVALKAITKVCG